MPCPRSSQRCAPGMRFHRWPSNAAPRRRGQAHPFRSALAEARIESHAPSAQLLTPPGGGCGRSCRRRRSGRQRTAARRATDPRPRRRPMGCTWSASARTPARAGLGRVRISPMSRTGSCTAGEATVAGAGLWPAGADYAHGLGNQSDRLCPASPQSVPLSGAVFRLIPLLCRHENTNC